MPQLQVRYRPTSELTPDPRNARTHSRRQVQQICESIRSFGFVSPVLVDEDGKLIAGHGRWEAAALLEMDSIPVIELKGLSDTQKRGLALADNKIASNAGWDLELLNAELADLSEMTLDFSLDATGFEIGEIDFAIEQNRGTEPEALEQVEEPSSDARVISRFGDLWLLGDHRVLCEDATSPEAYERLMGEDVADAGFTDPPYNVPIDGHVSGKGKAKHREFVQASGEMSSPEFTTFLTVALTLGAEHSRNGAVWFTFMDWRHTKEILQAGLSAFDDMLNLCVWAKTNGGMGSLYRSQHELVFVWKKGNASHTNNVQLGKFGRNRTNVWPYAGVNTFRPGRMEELQAHPTAKPVALVKDALLDVTKRGDILLDPFLGAGSTLIAAQHTRRRLRGIEIDPAYVDVTLRRYRDETGDEPFRASDGALFSDVERKSREGGAS